MPDFTNIALRDIIVPENRARSYDPLKAEALAGSIAEQGLFHPITVRQTGNMFELVLGLHRYRAAEMNKFDSIEARISDLSDDEARLAEVLENLARVELNALDRCQHLFDLKQSYERQYPAAGHGKESPKRKSLPLSEKPQEIFGFSRNVAERIGLSQRTICLAVAIWAGLSNETRSRLYGTDLAKKQTELKALSDLSETLQTKALDLIFDETGDVTNASGALAALKGNVALTPVEREVIRLSKEIDQIENAALDMIISEYAERMIASLERLGRL